jgi:hypothetical protein
MRQNSLIARKFAGLPVVDRTKVTGLFGCRLALCGLLRAAAALARKAAAEQSEFWADQCRGRDHREPGLCRARRRLCFDPRIHDAQQRHEIYRSTTGSRRVLAQRSQPRPAVPQPMVAVGPRLSRARQTGRRNPLAPTKAVIAGLEFSRQFASYRRRLKRIVTETSIRGCGIPAGKGGKVAPRIISSTDVSRSG